MTKQKFRAASLLLLASLTAGNSYAAFGLSSDASFHTIDTGAGTVFKIRRIDAGSNTSPGDIASLKFNGIEIQDASKGSHIASGFDWIYQKPGTGTSAVAIDAAVVNTNYIKVTVSIVSADGNLTHYYMVKNGDPNIYMATHITAEPTVGEFRWISRLNASVLTGVPIESSLIGTTGAIESSDIFGFNSGPNQGQTRSKYYGNQRAIDYSIRGVTGAGVGVFMLYDKRERASGGPFFRDIQNQSGGNTELYNYMNSGHNQTEAFRVGLSGPYALLLTTGSTPTLPDMSWIKDMGLTGYIAPVDRGAVTVAGLTGRDSNYKYTVGFANAAAQYWTAVDEVDGHFSKSGMLPGDYTMTVYKNELAVDTRSVTVTANTSYALNPLAITADPSSSAAVWRIGNWDGTPLEFVNGDKLSTMHPSDVRMSSWTLPAYIVGSSQPATGFPAYQWKDVNGNMVIKFNLRRGQVLPYRLRVGITAAYNGARPRVQVNGWLSGSPAQSNQPKSRSLTIGTYRGNNALYTFDIPASELVVGQNTITLFPISGTAGSKFLSPGYAIDALDLIKTP